MLKGCLWPASALCLATAAIAIVTHANAADVVTDWGARAVAIGAEKQLPKASSNFRNVEHSCQHLGARLPSTELFGLKTQSLIAVEGPDH